MMYKGKEKRKKLDRTALSGQEWTCCNLGLPARALFAHTAGCLQARGPGVHWEVRPLSWRKDGGPCAVDGEGFHLSGVDLLEPRRCCVLGVDVAEAEFSINLRFIWALHLPLSCFSCILRCPTKQPCPSAASGCPGASIHHGCPLCGRLTAPLPWLKHHLTGETFIT